MRTIADMYYEEGIEQGIERGIKKGREEGERKGSTIESILALLGA